jgi:hypothetical protein
MATEGTRKRSKIEAALEAADTIIEEQKDTLDVAIEELNKKLAPFDKLKEKRDRLVKARNALSGGNTLTGAGGTRLTWQMLAEELEKTPGQVPEELAKKFNVKTTNITSALWRQKDKFINKNGRYYVRDPEAGINTADDIEDEE